MYFSSCSVLRRTGRVCFATGHCHSPCTRAGPARTWPVTKSAWSSVRKKGTMMSWVSQSNGRVVYWWLGWVMRCLWKRHLKEVEVVSFSDHSLQNQLYFIDLMLVVCCSPFILGSSWVCEPSHGQTGSSSRLKLLQQKLVLKGNTVSYWCLTCWALSANEISVFFKALTSGISVLPSEDSCPEGSIDLKCKERVTDSDEDEPDGQVGSVIIQ